MNMTKPARNLDPALQSMMPVLYLIATASFAANLSVRAIDPVLPHIADDLAVSIAEAAGLSAALAFTFAIVQPIVGAVADLIGKARVMITCLGLLGIVAEPGGAPTEPQQVRADQQALGHAPFVKCL